MYLELGFGQRAQDDRKLRRTVGLVNDLLLRFSRYRANDLLLIAEQRPDVNQGCAASIVYLQHSGGVQQTHSPPRIGDV